VRARARLLVAMNRIIDTWSDYTNHDHAQRLPATTQALQAVVAQCLRALESQQWCHNIGCATLPEENAIFCETKAAEIAEAMLSPNGRPPPGIVLPARAYQEKPAPHSGLRSFHVLAPDFGCPAGGAAGGHCHVPGTGLLDPCAAGRLGRRPRRRAVERKDPGR